MLKKLTVAGAAFLALALAGMMLSQTDPYSSQRVVLVQQYNSQPRFQVAQGQQLPEYQVQGTMESGSPPPEGVPLSFQFPFPLPGPSPPTPNVITIGPRPKKAPVCKECERQMRKIKVVHVETRIITIRN
jgi:hypothetical protein